MNVLKLHEGSFATSEAVAIDEIEEEEIADICPRNLGEELLDLLSREKPDWSL